MYTRTKNPIPDNLHVSSQGDFFILGSKSNVPPQVEKGVHAITSPQSDAAVGRRKSSVKNSDLHVLTRGSRLGDSSTKQHLTLQNDQNSRKGFFHERRLTMASRASKKEVDKLQLTGESVANF